MGLRRALICLPYPYLEWGKKKGPRPTLGESAAALLGPEKPQLPPSEAAKMWVSAVIEKPCHSWSSWGLDRPLIVAEIGDLERRHRMMPRSSWGYRLSLP